MNPKPAAHTPDYRFCVAPMVGYSDRHARYLLRLLTRRARLFTEMTTTSTLLYGAPERRLAFHPAEHPLVLQLAGSDPQDLARCASLGEQWGYDEINLNIGCPSERAGQGRFGVCLMREAAQVADCVAAMDAAVQIPLSLKCRTGVDDHEGLDFLLEFLDTVAAAGCHHFIIHARKALLRLGTRANRSIPPLCYDTVHQAKQQRPKLHIILNGGLTDLAQAAHHLPQVDGVMMGRRAYHNPWLLTQVDARFFADPRPAPTREQVLEAYLEYMEGERKHGTPAHNITRHLTQLFKGEPGVQQFRRHLSEHRCTTPEEVHRAWRTSRQPPAPIPPPTAAPPPNAPTIAPIPPTNSTRFAPAAVQH